MKLTKVLSLLLLVVSVPSFAVGVEQSVLFSFLGFIGVAANIGVLIHLLFILVGMYSLYQLVAVFATKNDDQRGDETKKLPFYFIGAALGMGSFATSTFVQETVFGSGYRSADKFEMERSFKLDDSDLGLDD